MLQPVRLTAAETRSLTKRISNEDVKKRVLAEARVVKLFCESMIAAGFTISISPTEGEDWTVRRSTDIETIMLEIQSTDMDLVRVRRADRSIVGECVFIYGNSASEVINDHHTSLQEWMGPVNEYISTLEARGE